VGLYPDNLNAWFSYAGFLARTGWEGKAREIALFMLGKFDRQAFDLQAPRLGRHMEGILNLQAGRIAEALSHFHHIRRARPADTAAMLAESVAHEINHNLTTAREGYASLHADEDGGILALYFLTTMHMREGNYPEALHPLEEAEGKRRDHSSSLSRKLNYC